MSLLSASTHPVVYSEPPSFSSSSLKSTSRASLVPASLFSVLLAHLPSLSVVNPITAVPLSCLARAGPWAPVPCFPLPSLFSLLSFRVYTFSVLTSFHRTPIGRLPSWVFLSSLVVSSLFAACSLRTWYLCDCLFHPVLRVHNTRSPPQVRHAAGKRSHLHGILHSIHRSCVCLQNARSSFLPLRN